jgi:hypothetical protein
MPRKKKEVIADETVVETPVVETENVSEAIVEPEKPVEVAEKKLADVSVYDTNGNLIRVYAKEVHGENFYQLAEQFILRRPGYILK